MPSTAVEAAYDSICAVCGFGCRPHLTRHGAPQASGVIDERGWKHVGRKLLLSGRPHDHVLVRAGHDKVVALGTDWMQAYHTAVVVQDTYSRQKRSV